MGYNIFIKAMLNGETITVYGDGKQSRGNTYVSDCVNATIAAINSPDGETYNIGGGEIASVWEIIERLEKSQAVKPKLNKSRPVQGISDLQAQIFPKRSEILAGSLKFLWKKD